MEELGICSLEYNIVEHYETEAQNDLYYSLEEYYDMNNNEVLNYSIGISLTSGFPYVDLSYKITDIVTITSPGDNGGVIENNIDYFSSMKPTITIDEDGYQSNSTINSPLPAEYHSYYGQKVYIQTPDLAPYEFEIPQEDIISVSLRKELNSPIKWSVVLKNYTRKFTDPDNATYGGLIKKGIYSVKRNTRKFIRIKFRSIYDNIPLVEYDFPRLVINEKSGTKEITIGGVDEISNYLYSRCDIPTYCVMETLTPVADSKTESEGESYYTQYEMINLTDKVYNPIISTIWVNGSQPTESFSRSGETLTSSSPINSRFAVILLNPKMCKDIIKDIINKVIDKQPEGITKEYFPVILDFNDYKINADVPIQNKEPIRVIEELIAIRVCDWYPYNAGNGKIGLLIKTRPIDYEYPSVGEFVLRPQNLREKPQIGSSNVTRINTINVIRPAVIVTKVELVAPVTT